VTQGFLTALKRADPSFRPKLIFDVGANLGQSVELFLAAFPEARIQCFEPAESTFAALSTRFGADPRVSLDRLALDHRDHEVRFLNRATSAGNRILREGESEVHATRVPAMRGDTFCAERRIEGIDIVKIDTEGNDLRVLAGFAAALQAKRIGYLQVECTTSPDNHFHVQLDRVMHFLHPFGYRLFGLFDFVRRIYRTQQKLNGIWFCNAAFVREVENPRLRKERIN
jgi:FkbM family methyltransferase